MNNTDDIFKKILWADIGTLVFFIFVIFAQPTFGLDPTLVEWQIYIGEQMNILIALLSLPLIIAVVVSYPLLFKYKKLGRTLYLWTCIIGFSIVLFIGPSIMDPVSFFVNNISCATSGALLILLYFTPLREKFEIVQETKSSTSKSNITSELERITKLHQEGVISDEEFKAAKEKLLK